jgi:DNA-binding CsgD family transcriptional regulator
MSKQALTSRKAAGLAANQRRLALDEHFKNSTAQADKLPGLSGRESEVLSWVAQGKTNSEVAMILGISRRTVDTLLSRTYQKLGVETRMAAVMRIIKFIKIFVVCCIGPLLDLFRSI